jgi:hypothetical protein
MIDTSQSLIAYCRKNGRVCPKPYLWNNLWKLLPNRRQIGVGWQPSLPLILAAWHHTSNLEKMLRLAEHVERAEKHGKLAEVAAFIRNLSEDEWHHLGNLASTNHLPADPKL